MRQLRGKAMANETRCRQVYAAAGRVASIADRRSDGTAICSFAFTRDANGNILTSQCEDGWWWQRGFHDSEQPKVA